MSLWEELRKSFELTEAQKAAANAPVSYEPLTQKQMDALKYENLYDSKGNYKGPKKP